jgi:hypothetical protein
MDNPETQATLGSQDTGRRQRKQKAQHRKLTKGEQHVPTKNPVTKGEQHVPIKNPGVCDKVCQCLATGRLYSSITQVFCHQLKQSPCYCSDNTTCI